MFTPSADAALVTFDFAAMANAAPGEGGPATGPYVAADGTTSVSASATGGTPYLDASSGGLPGGMGVCSDIAPGDPFQDCADSADDNLGLGEMLTLTFASTNPQVQTFTITAISFRDAGHTTIFDADAFGGIDVIDGADGGFAGAFDPSDGSGVLGLNGVGFKFTSPIEFGNGTEELYISSITVELRGPGGEEVPEPGTIGLMLIGLGMLAGGRKFRNRKNS